MFDKAATCVCTCLPSRIRLDHFGWTVLEWGFDLIAWNRDPPVSMCVVRPYRKAIADPKQTPSSVSWPHELVCLFRRDGSEQSMVIV